MNRPHLPRAVCALDLLSVLRDVSSELVHRLLLFVEDDPKTAGYLEAGLSENGFEVDVAARGDEGLRLARFGEHDLTIRVKGNGIGADDHLVKPCAFAELLARVRALLRHGPSEVSDGSLSAIFVSTWCTGKSAAEVGTSSSHLPSFRFPVSSCAINGQTDRPQTMRLRGCKPDRRYFPAVFQTKTWGVLAF